MRLTPREPWKPLYRAQAWYWPVIYSGIAFDFIIRDFMMVFIGKSDANHVYPKMSTSDKVTFWLGKLFYAVIMFGIPLAGLSLVAGAVGVRPDDVDGRPGPGHRVPARAHQRRCRIPGTRRRPAAYRGRVGHPPG